MKKMIVLLAFTVLSFSSFAQNSLTNKTSQISLTIDSENKNAVKSDGLLIKVHFNNLRNETVKLLDLFDPEGIFFSITITKEDGNIISPSGAGKMDFGKANKFKYIEISQSSSYTKVLNISATLKKQGISLAPGKYKIKISYHNQYGSDCIKGWFNSNEIPFVIN
ncbi:hypothetical protein DBR40_25495 [Pedobacter sp. KBW01]|uniref:hypothetical protein n=1 Tax=Pedobacter sp. KBW01 TaxID=2153364 RepID=UPI000F598179|nr:hypothetical protein [Pedobacter sp. KBW01]RQO64383.1 hypothetical protein DBR40_25495 [Pedobacter sp. KBW01]